VIELESSSPEETERIAAGLAAGLVPGDVVTVSGELGTGKTTFVRGACRALGVGGHVTSPTYTVGQLYEGRVPVSHLDLYRFEGMSDEEWGRPGALLRERGRLRRMAGGGRRLLARVAGDRRFAAPRREA